MPGNLYCDQTLTSPWQGAYFYTNTVKVGTIRLTHSCIVILVGAIIIDNVYMKTLLILKKKGYKIGAQNSGFLITTVV